MEKSLEKVQPPVASAAQPKEKKSRKGIGGPKPQTVQVLVDKGVLPKDWKEKIITMSAQGMSDVEIRAKICMPGGKFSHDLWYALKERETEFAETIQIGKVLCQAWWEEQGRKADHLMHSKGQVFETGLWYANMKNRFGWRDKTEIEHDLSDPLLEKFKNAKTDDLIKESKGLARLVLAAGGDKRRSSKAPAHKSS